MKKRTKAQLRKLLADALILKSTKGIHTPSYTEYVSTKECGYSTLVGLLHVMLAHTGYTTKGVTPLPSAVSPAPPQMLTTEHRVKVIDGDLDALCNHGYHRLSEVVSCILTGEGGTAFLHTIIDLALKLYSELYEIEIVQRNKDVLERIKCSRCGDPHVPDDMIDGYCVSCHPLTLSAPPTPTLPSHTGKAPLVRPPTVEHVPSKR